MSVSSANAQAAPKVRKTETLTSGTSWTVPAGVTFVNVTLIGGGGGGGGASSQYVTPAHGLGGQIVSTTVATTPGASITYAIGAGGTAGSNPSGSGGTGGTTTFTGATSALGGFGAPGEGSSAAGLNGRDGLVSNNGGASSGRNGGGGTGGAGCIIIEYWVAG